MSTCAYIFFLSHSYGLTCFYLKTERKFAEVRYGNIRGFRIHMEMENNNLTEKSFRVKKKGPKNSLHTP